MKGQAVAEIKDEAEPALRGEIQTLKPEEAAVLAMLEGWLKRTLEDSLKESLGAVKKAKAKEKPPQRKAAPAPSRRPPAENRPAAKSRTRPPKAK